MSRRQTEGVGLQAKLHKAFFAGGADSLHNRLESHPMYKQQILVRGKQFRPNTLLAYFVAIYFYQTALEKRLVKERGAVCVRRFFDDACIAELFSAMHLSEDIRAMGCDIKAVRQQPANQLARMHLERLDSRQSHLLIGHLYLRYLGDLHGGSIIAGILERKVREVVAVPEYRLSYLSPVRAMDGAQRSERLTAMETALNAVPQELHEEVVDEMKQAAQMTLRLFDTIAAAQLHSRCSSVRLVAVVLLVAVVGLAVLAQFLPIADDTLTLAPR